jgi:16S rRNA (cytosine1402-N4)-methyltransferase
MRHVPVLLNEVLASLNLRSGMNVVDCTLGDGGHSEKILEKISPNGKVLGIDVDPESLLRAKQFLYRFEGRVIFVRNNFTEIKKIVEENNFSQVKGVLMDFGWSSPQFAERERGLSFQNPNELLDMRYGSTFEDPIFGLSNPTAAELLNTLPPEKLEYIFSSYGEENLSGDIAHAVRDARKRKLIATVGDFVEIVLQCYRTKLKTDKEIPWIGGLHPATKVFQALRIAVNDELGVIEKVLAPAIDVLEPGGRLAVINFHSLEDRIVKHYFKSVDEKTVKIITRKPIECAEDEYKNNPPSRSAKLRVVEKL